MYKRADDIKNEKKLGMRWQNVKILDVKKCYGRPST